MNNYLTLNQGTAYVYLNILEITKVDFEMGGYIEFLMRDKLSRTTHGHAYLKMSKSFELYYNGKYYKSKDQISELAMDVEQYKTENAINSLA